MLVTCHICDTASRFESRLGRGFTKSGDASPGFSLVLHDSQQLRCVLCHCSLASADYFFCLSERFLCTAFTPP